MKKSYKERFFDSCKIFFSLFCAFMAINFMIACIGLMLRFALEGNGIGVILSIGALVVFLILLNTFSNCDDDDDDDEIDISFRRNMLNSNQNISKKSTHHGIDSLGD